MPLPTKNSFDPRDFALLEHLALATLLHPNFATRRDSSYMLEDTRIVYDPSLEGYKTMSAPLSQTDRRIHPIRYSVKKVSLHECLVVLDLRGRKLPNTRLGLCTLPERYVKLVKPEEVIPVVF